MMDTIKIKGLSFVQTHERDPERYDVRDANWIRIAYVEFNDCNLVCITSDGAETTIYEEEIDAIFIDCLDDEERTRLYLGHVADAIEKRLTIKRMKVKVWRVTGYKGFDDYDDPSQNNINCSIAMDARLKKEEIEEFFVNRYSKKSRVVVIEATEVREVEI